MKCYIGGKRGCLGANFVRPCDATTEILALEAFPWSARQQPLVQP